MTKKALLVGINSYPGNALNGCLNDVKDWHDVLTSIGGFNPDNVQVITDQRANTQGIKAGLAMLAAGLKPGDEVFWAYSGHGTQVRLYQNSKLSGGMDDAICPVNLDDPDYWENGLITDHFISDWLASFPSGVRTTLVIDACHSGSITEAAAREMNPHPTKARFLPPPMDIALRFSHPIHHRGIVRRKFGRGASPSERGVFGKKKKTRDLSTTIVPINHILLSGCRSDQTSADAFINGRYNGAFSYFAINEPKKGVTQSLNVIHAAYLRDLKTGGYSQEPQLEGPQDRVNSAFFV
jgi:hypothetical protein